MITSKITKSSMFVMTAALLLATAAVISPVNMVHAQGNTTNGNMSADATKGNLSAVIDVDTLSKNIKERHPLLAKMSAEEDKNQIVVKKGRNQKKQQRLLSR